MAGEVVLDPQPRTQRPSSRIRIARRREVAIAGDDAEAIDAAGVEQVHGVDHERDVGRVLASDVLTLLDGPDAVPGEQGHPGRKTRGRPVAVDPFDGGATVVLDLGEKGLEQAVGDVVGVDQDGEPAVPGREAADSEWWFSMPSRSAGSDL